MNIGISGSREVKKYKVLKEFLDRFNQEKTKIILFSIFFIDYRYSTFGHRNKKAIKEYEKKH